jgi:hypothetical protein
MNNGQSWRNCEHHRFISIVAINVRQFIDDSEIYDTIIMMMHFSGKDDGRQDPATRGKSFMALHLQEMTCGCKRCYLLNGAFL